MITRRDATIGGLLTIAWTSIACACPAHAAGTSAAFGCMLADDEADKILAASSEHQTFTTGNEPIVASSGDREFDYALAQTLSRITDTFQVLPGFAYYDDFDGPNAYATKKVRMARADGTVLFGRRFLRTILAKPEHPDAVVTAICAHEFGHILQLKLNLERTLRADQTTAKRVELHADYLAGYYAGTQKLRKPDYPAAVFATESYSHGDFEFTRRNHHGRPEERAAAVIRGFEVAYRERRNLSDAVRIGMNFVATT